MTESTKQPGWNPAADPKTELFQLATSLRDLIAQAIEQGSTDTATDTLTRAQTVAGMLVAEVANMPPPSAAPERPGDAEAVLAWMDAQALDTAYGQWQSSRQAFAVDAAADDKRAGLMRLGSVHWACFERQSRLLGELIDRALIPEHAGQERTALQGAKALLVLQYRQAFDFCEAVRRLVEGQA